MNTEGSTKSSEEKPTLSDDDCSSLADGKDGYYNSAFITIENEDGEFEQVPVLLEDNQFTVGYTDDQPRKSIFDGFISKDDNDDEDDEDTDGITLRGKLKELAKTEKKRVIAKGGSTNITMINRPKIHRQFLKDIFTTAVDMPWRYTILAFTTSFFLTWFLFAVIWWIIGYAHGDFEEDNLPTGAAQKNGTFTPCVWAIHNFASCFLFSVETQHTIGYGSRQTSEECPEAIIIMALQSVIGVLSSSCMAGIVFAKLARPKNRMHTVMFSKNAVISMRNGSLYLLCRVANMRKSLLIEAHVRGKIIYRSKSTAEGEKNLFYQEGLKLSTLPDSEEDRCTLHFPTTLYHKIDDESPFYKMGPRELLNSKFEMVIILEGIIETTGNSLQVKTSFLPREILWGHRFENMVSYAVKPGTYAVDCSYLNAVVPDNTPRKSMEAIVAERKRKKSQQPRPRISMKSVTGMVINRNRTVGQRSESMGALMPPPHLIKNGSRDPSPRAPREKTPSPTPTPTMPSSGSFSINSVA